MNTRNVNVSLESGISSFKFVCKIKSCGICCTVFSVSSMSFESSDWLEGTWKTIRGLNRLSPWTQMDQLNPLTFSLLFAFFSVVVKAMCTDQGRMARWYISTLHRHPHTNIHTLKHPLALVEDSLHLSAFKNLLSLFSQGPALLSLSSSSPLLTLSLLDLCSMCFIHFQFFYTARHLCSLYILFLSVIFDCLPIIVLLSSRGTSLPPCLVKWNFKNVLRFIVMSVEAVLGIRIRFYCLTLAVFCRRLSPPAVWMSTCWRLFLL